MLISQQECRGILEYYLFSGKIAMDWTHVLKKMMAKQYVAVI